MTTNVKPLKWTKKDEEGTYRSLDGRWEIRLYKQGRQRDATHELVDLERREAAEAAGNRYFGEGYDGVRYLKEQAAYETATGINVAYEQQLNELSAKRSAKRDEIRELDSTLSDLEWKIRYVNEDDQDAELPIVALRVSMLDPESRDKLRKLTAEFLTGSDAAELKETTLTALNKLRDEAAANKAKAEKEEDAIDAEIDALHKPSFRDYKIAQNKRKHEIQRLRWQVEELRRKAETDEDREYAEAAAVQLAELESR